MPNVETGRYNIEFNPNNIVEDKYKVEQVLKTFQKGGEYTYNGEVYQSFSRKTGLGIETVFIKESRLNHLQEEYKAIRKAMKNIEEFKVETTTQIQLQNLQQNMSNNRTETQVSTDNGRTQAEIQAEIQAMDNERLKQTIDDLLEKYKELKKGIRGAEGNGDTKRTLKSRLTENIESLERMQRDLNKHSYNNLSTFKARVGELIYYFEHYEQVRQLVVLGQKTSDIHTIIDSKQDAKRARRQETRDAKYQQEMNSILHDVALTSMWNNDMERYEEYLEAVVNGQVEPSTHPFFTAHSQSFSMIQGTNPSLYQTLVPSDGTRISYDVYCQNRNCDRVCRGKSCCSKGFNRKFGERFANMLEQIFPERMNRDPRQKEAWTNIGSLIAVGGAIFMGIKAITSLKKGEDGKRNRGAAAGWTAGTLALLYSDDVLSTLQDALNLHPAEKTRAVTDMFGQYGFTDAQAASMADRYVGAPVATISALHFIPVYDLYSQHILEDNNNQITFNYNNYERYLNTLGLSDEQKQQLLRHGQNIRDNNLIGLGLGTFGINTMSDLTTIGNGNQSMTLGQVPQVQQGYNSCVERISNGVNAELYKQGLRAKDPTSLDQIIKEYDAEKDTTGIKKLIIRWMKAGLLEISANDKNYNLDEMLNNPSVDIENMTMKGFTHSGGNEIKFETYSELFDTVNVTDRIKYNFAGRPAKSSTPFHYSLPGNRGKLKFDDKEWYEVLQNETGVLTWRSMMFNLKTLGKNKEFYADYLNKRRQGTTKVDVTTYPLSNATGIDFYGNNQEVIDFEQFLNELKTEYSGTYGVLGDDPYKINVLGQMSFTDSNDTEYTIDAKLYKFKTIWFNRQNREKLLKFLNDPSNGMFKDPTV